METALTLAATTLAALVLVWPRIAGNTTWRATLTPLASIIGSGFLVLGPLLQHSFGAFAPLAMLALCSAAWAFGAAIRFNIARRAAKIRRSAAETRLELAASWALAFAYFISVAYYLNLFGAFGVKLTPFASGLNARLLTTAVFLLILAIGWTRGFGALERLEQVTVTVKLAIIAGLLAGLFWTFAEAAGAGHLRADPARVTGLAALTLGFGLIVTVQGFETSRYLGAEYDAPTRIRSMRLAQALSAAIYLAYLLPFAFTFHVAKDALTETAIIDLMGQVAPILPLLLTVAALAAQFSAAVADTGGSGGLLRELTARRLPLRWAYAALTASGLALTWAFDVFEIIAHASRAFALYYALQSALAAVGAWRQNARGKSVVFAILAVLAAAITAFGQAIE